MHKTPLISVIIPVFNTAPWLDRCLESLLLQDFRDFEVLAVDDGSTDGSADILKKLASRDARIHLFTSSETRGMSAARNTALDTARGEWLLFLDSDDWVSPGFLSCPLEKAAASGADLVVFQAVREFDPGLSARSGKSAQKRAVPCGLKPGDYGPEPVLRALCDFSLSTHLWNKLYHRSLFDGIRLPVGEAWEDAAVMHLLIDRADRISVIPEVLYHYAERPGSLTRQAYQDKTVYYWRYLQYGRRYAYMQAHYPEIAEKMKGSVLESRLKYCAIKADSRSYAGLRREILSSVSISDLGKLPGLPLKAAFLLLQLPAPVFRAAAKVFVPAMLK